MLELVELITLFYPDKSLKERDQIQARCKKGVDYDAKGWLDISFSDLKMDRVKDNLILTFYYNQNSYYGVIDEILVSLENWSNGILNFPELGEDDSMFYERFYGLTGFTFFPYLTPTTQIYLLGSRFLLQASIWGLPVISRVQQYFSRFCSLDILKRDAIWFAEAIKKNNTPIEKNVTLGEWLTNKTLDTVTISDPTIQEACVTIGKLYLQLLSNEIWADLDFSTCSHAKTGHPEVVNVEELYLHRLRETRDLSAWIQDYESIAEWCKGRSAEFIKKILQVVKEKLPLSQYEDNIVNFVSALGNNGFEELAAEVILFNESTSQFEWNPELLN